MKQLLCWSETVLPTNLVWEVTEYVAGLAEYWPRRVYTASTVDVIWCDGSLLTRVCVCVCACVCMCVSMSVCWARRTHCVLWDSCSAWREIVDTSSECFPVGSCLRRLLTSDITTVTSVLTCRLYTNSTLSQSVLQPGQASLSLSLSLSLSVCLSVCLVLLLYTRVVFI